MKVNIKYSGNQTIISFGKGVFEPGEEVVAYEAHGEKLIIRQAGVLETGLKVVGRSKNTVKVQASRNAVPSFDEGNYLIDKEETKHGYIVVYKEDVFQGEGLKSEDDETE